MKHWQLEFVDERAIVTLDVVGSSANVLSREVLQEFDDILAEVKNKPLTGLIIRSNKQSGFIAGADVREFQHIDDATRAAELARTGQQVFNRLADLPFPTVAVIHGYCLGGGLELALACTYRVARDDAGTRLGLPEVRLGINPGFAGTVRLPRLVGAVTALDLMLTGRSVSGKQARRLGLVDAISPPRHLMSAAVACLSKRRARRKLPWSKRVMAIWPLR
ncbi:MAG: enoyl-CoA hydratase-related protein, partial [Acidiferrobacterales bacterium]